MSSSKIGTSLLRDVTGFVNSLLLFQAVVLKQDAAVGIYIRPGVLDLPIYKEFRKRFKL
jgi:hypothetical protein